MLVVKKLTRHAKFGCNDCLDDEGNSETRTGGLTRVNCPKPKVLYDNTAQKPFGMIALVLRKISLELDIRKEKLFGRLFWSHQWRCSIGCFGS
jgi:hypothetical protein